METSSFLDHLSIEAATLKLPFSDSQKAQCEIYLSLLTEWNQKMNLTAVTDPRRILEYHFIDSFTLASMLPKISIGSLIDVGSGAGFPGVICAILHPNYSITLVERIQKKAVFLLALRRELGLSFQVVSDDISQIQKRLLLNLPEASQGGSRPSVFHAPFAAFRPTGLYDVAVSRATFPPKEWVSLGATLVKQGGLVFAMLGQKEKNVSCPQGCSLVQDFHYQIEGGTRVIQCFRRDSFTT